MYLLILALGNSIQIATIMTILWPQKNWKGVSQWHWSSNWFGYWDLWINWVEPALLSALKRFMLLVALQANQSLVHLVLHLLKFLQYIFYQNSEHKNKIKKSPQIKNQKSSQEHPWKLFSRNKRKLKNKKWLHFFEGRTNKTNGNNKKIKANKKA